MARYCPDCGKDLTCYKCGGKGRVEGKISIKYCCGAMRNGKYCPVCGKLLPENNVPSSVLTDPCPVCKGFGVVDSHLCISTKNT